MNRTRFDKTRNKKVFSGKGFYIALGVCLVAIGVSAWSTYNSVVEFVSPGTEQISSVTPKKETELSQLGQQTATQLSGITEDIVVEEPVVATEATPAKEDAAEEGGKEETRETDTLVVYPSSKNVIKEFSDVNPVYSKTLHDWRVHNGTDFSAEIGSMVRAMTSGVVSDIYDDPALGMTIVIDHDGGFTAYYSGLGDTTLVQKDQSVSAGDEIGSINDVPSEISDGSHLHLAVKKDSQWINPMEFLESGNKAE